MNRNPPMPFSVVEFVNRVLYEEANGAIIPIARLIRYGIRFHKDVVTAETRRRAVMRILDQVVQDRYGKKFKILTPAPTDQEREYLEVQGWYRISRPVLAGLFNCDQSTITRMIERCRSTRKIEASPADETPSCDTLNGGQGATPRRSLAHFSVSRDSRTSSTSSVGKLSASR